MRTQRHDSRSSLRRGQKVMKERLMQPLRRVAPWVGAIVAAGLLAGFGGEESHEQVRLAMFSDAACEKPLLQNGLPFVVTMDTGQACFSFSYTDPAGLVVPTSHANFRCENEKVVYDKYPFSSDCKQSTTSSAKPTMGYAISNTCQFAASHTGGVYEKLVDYRYPGNADCTVGR